MSAYHGLLLINKDPGHSSHDVVAKARRILNTKEVGHCGTLDPMASGLLVLLLGQATKLSQYVLDADKSYEVGFKLGFETDTLDTTGTVTKTFPIGKSVEDVNAIAFQLQGDFTWPVPHYSAMKVNGEKLYEKARRGEDFETPKKDMKFWHVEALPSNLLNTATQQDVEYRFRLSCSKGSFIRTWVQQLGQALGCGATMSSLVRTGSQPYRLEMAQNLNLLAEEVQRGQKPSGYIPLAFALPQSKRIRVQGQSQTLIANGQISYDLKSQLIQVFRPGFDEVVQILDTDQKLLALVGHEKQKGFHIKRVFHYEKPSS